MVSVDVLHLCHEDFDRFSPPGAHVLNPETDIVDAARPKDLFGAIRCRAENDAPRLHTKRKARPHLHCELRLEEERLKLFFEQSKTARRVAATPAQRAAVE